MILANWMLVEQSVGPIMLGMCLAGSLTLEEDHEQHGGQNMSECGILWRVLEAGEGGVKAFFLGVVESFRKFPKCVLVNLASFMMVEQLRDIGRREFRRLVMLGVYFAGHLTSKEDRKEDGGQMRSERGVL